MKKVFINSSSKQLFLKKIIPALLLLAIIILSLFLFFRHKQQSEPLAIETIAGREADKLQEEFKKDPIWLITPYDSYQQGIKIYAEPSNLPNELSSSSSIPPINKTKIIIYLYTCTDSEIEQLKTTALNYLSSHGITLEKYQIIYKHC